MPTDRLSVLKKIVSGAAKKGANVEMKVIKMDKKPHEAKEMIEDMKSMMTEDDYKKAMGILEKYCHSNEEY